MYLIYSVFKYFMTYCYSSQDGSVDIATGYRLDGWGLIPRRDKIFLLSMASRPVMAPTQHSIQWVHGGKAAEAWN
jgi:hypothetical protein